MERLKQLAFRDRTRALREIGQISRALPPVVSERFSTLLSSSPAPEEGLRYFVRLRERQPHAFHRLTNSVAGLQYLVAVFTNSRFLSEEILRHPEWAEELIKSNSLLRVLSADELREKLEAALSPGPPKALEFARFRRQQMLRILIRDLLDLAPLPDVTGELTALADAIVDTAHRRISQQLTAEYGTPQTEQGEEAKFSVLAVGKMGGQELNYSSDIDLIFLYSANGETAGPKRITNKEFFRHVANQLTEMLSMPTAEGIAYRVDLRLRPEGSQGEVCISLEGAREYYSHRARDWELQMLIKARACAGDKASARALLDFVEPRIYDTSLDFSAIEELSATRERLNEKLHSRSTSTYPRRETLDVKLAPGGIRDIEFLVQCLQRLYGASEPWVHHGGTMLALARLHDKTLLSDAEYGRLAAAYQFLRHLEHRLQFADDRQTHTLPSNQAELDALGARMPGGGDGAWLHSQIESHFANVNEIYNRVIHARALAADSPRRGEHQPGNVVRVLEQRAPRLATALSQGTLQRGYRAFEHFLERISTDPERVGRLDACPQLTTHVLDLFEHSPYFAEELIRTPELMDELAPRDRKLDPPPPFPEASASSVAAMDLRRWYRRMMTRIQAASICQSEPVFETLARTSELADIVISRAYDLALSEVLASRPLSEQGYRPANQMWVIALGRLGMQEFDLASDADLVFVLADSDEAEMEFWTAVARRIVDSIMTYTVEGILFTVDTRLRPNGNSGPLVLTEHSFKDYFARSAEAWEGIAYMKSRVVAGDAARGESFLHQLQQIDWERYGQSGRSRLDLRQMRAKIEREQGAAHPFKAGRGGYYDIDFILMYLRLKSAGVYFKVLNTVERTEVLEHMGQLDRASAKFLRDAATFYRALDHGVRVLTGHAEAKLPTSDAQLEALTALMKRWSPIPLSDMDEIRNSTRAAFEKMFW